MCHVPLLPRSCPDFLAAFSFATIFGKLFSNFFADVGGLRPIRALDVRQRGFGEECSGIRRVWETSDQSVRDLAAACQDRAVVGAAARCRTADLQEANYRGTQWGVHEERAGKAEDQGGRGSGEGKCRSSGWGEARCQATGRGLILPPCQLYAPILLVFAFTKGLREGVPLKTVFWRKHVVDGGGIRFRDHWHPARIAKKRITGKMAWKVRMKIPPRWNYSTVKMRDATSVISHSMPFRRFSPDIAEQGRISQLCVLMSFSSNTCDFEQKYQK